MTKSKASLFAIVLLAGCGSTARPKEPAPELGPVLGSTHVLRDEAPAAPQAPVVKMLGDLQLLVSTVGAISSEADDDHARLAAALTALADTLFVVASGTEDHERIGNHRKRILAEVELFSSGSPASPDHAKRVRTMLDQVVLAISAGTARTSAELPAYNVAAAQLVEAVRQVDPDQALAGQRATVSAALRLATNALHIANGLPAPFATSSSTS